MIKKIPATVEVTCDICKTKMNNGLGRPGAYRMRGKIYINAVALDVMGDAVANASQEFDVCDACLSKIREAINNLVRKT